jgi:hypothetical protein
VAVLPEQEMIYRVFLKYTGTVTQEIQKNCERKVGLEQ